MSDPFSGASPGTPAVSVANLTKVYRSGLIRRETVRALDGATLSIPPGTIFGLLGPNGAGKSTLVKIVLDVVHATSGEATVFGVPSTEASARQRVGFLPEDHEFPSFLTAEQVLHVYGRMGGVGAEKRKQRIPELLDRVGLADRSGSKVKGFSKGMAQRLGMAQALINDPDLLILDEPTDGVDPVGRREVRDLLLWLREQGTTVFLNSHLLSEVEKVCSRVAILQDGTVVREGTTEELTAVERVYDVTCTPVPDAVLDRFAPDGASDENATGEPATNSSATIRPADESASENGLRRYHVRAEDRTDLNAFLDRLRSADVELESVRPLRRTLEDYFIDVVSRPE